MAQGNDIENPAPHCPEGREKKSKLRNKKRKKSKSGSSCCTVVAIVSAMVIAGALSSLLVWKWDDWCSKSSGSSHDSESPSTVSSETQEVKETGKEAKRAPAEPEEIKMKFENDNYTFKLVTTTKPLLMNKTSGTPEGDLPYEDSKSVYWCDAIPYPKLLYVTELKETGKLYWLMNITYYGAERSFGVSDCGHKGQYGIEYVEGELPNGKWVPMTMYDSKTDNRGRMKLQKGGREVTVSGVSG